MHGPSGVGKSQILRALADMTEHEGEILLEGRPQWQYAPSEWRRKVALLPAESGWWTDVVIDHFSQLPQPDWLERLGLAEDALNWSAARLSSGERQRLALLRALVNRPRVLLLDEPAANLDEASAAGVESLIRDYLDNESACAIWVSHDSAERERMADQSMLVAANEAVS